MERIQLYKVRKVNVKFFIGFSVLVFAYGLFLFIHGLNNGFVFFRNWSSITFMAQGIVFFVLAYQQWYKGKYFIAFDHQYLSYQLLGQKKIERIAVSDIEKLKLDGIEIQIQTKKEIRNFRFEYIEWQELNRLKSLVKDLQESMAIDKQ